MGAPDLMRVTDTDGMEYFALSHEDWNRLWNSTEPMAQVVLQWELSLAKLGVPCIKSGDTVYFRSLSGEPHEQATIDSLKAAGFKVEWDGSSV